jgi:hypothetical protein
VARYLVLEVFLVWEEEEYLDLEVPANLSLPLPQPRRHLQRPRTPLKMVMVAHMGLLMVAVVAVVAAEEPQACRTGCPTLQPKTLTHRD